MKNICILQKIISLKVLAVRGYRGYEYSGRKRRNKYGFAPVFILFSDKKTFIELQEQDQDYHDCSSIAKEINLRQDKIEWKRMFKDRLNYPIADINI